MKTIQKTLEIDPFLMHLHKSIKGFKSVNFINLYGSLLKLGYKEEEIIAFYGLDNTYKDWVKSLL